MILSPSALAAALVLLAQTGAAPQTPTVPLSLDEAIAIASQNAYDIAIQKTQLEKSNSRLQQAKNSLKPSISASGTYQRFGSETFTQGGGQNAVIDSRTVGASVQIPIDLSGGFGRQINAARRSRDASALNVDSTLNFVRLSVKAAYFSVLQAQSLVAVQVQALEQSKARLKQGELQFKADQIAKVDVQRYRALVFQTESNLLTAQNALVLAKNALNETLSRPIETPVEVVDLPELPMVDLEAADLVSGAVSVRPDVLSVEATLKALTETRRAAETGDDPTLAVGLNWQRSFAANGRQAGDTSATGTVTLSIPLFDQGQTRERVKQARLDEDATRIQLNQLKLSISAEVRRSLSNLQNARARYDSAVEQVKLAEEVFRIASIREDVGEATYLEVIDAQTDLTSAKNQLVTTRYDALTALAQLQKAVGRDALQEAVDAAKKQSAGKEGVLKVNH
jgi:outer membrane protein